jgi:hypothetical protein
MDNDEKNRSFMIFGFDVYNVMNTEGISDVELLTWLKKRREELKVRLTR